MINGDISVLTISLPEYRLESETDWLSIGRKLDGLIGKAFPGERLAFRGIGLQDHPSKSLDSLVDTICALGTDKYDPDRCGLHYAREETSDIHAMPCVVTPDGLHAEKHLEGSPSAEFVQLFYEGALADRGYSVRIDLLMVYDLDQLPPLHGLPPENCYEFAFRHPGNKRNALLGIVKILR